VNKDQEQTMHSNPAYHASGADLIAAERQRQIDAEGYDPAHDDAHTNGELGEAATAYIQGDGSWWPWDNEWKPWDGRVRSLVKAGALIAAEIDRVQRAEGGR